MKCRAYTQKNLLDGRFAELYAELCTWFWYHDHPDYPRDGNAHTSDLCRAKATQVFNLLGLEELLDRAESADERTDEVLILRANLQEAINRTPTPESVLAVAQRTSGVYDDLPETWKGDAWRPARIRAHIGADCDHWPIFLNGDYVIARPDNDHPEKVLAYSLRMALNFVIEPHQVDFI